MDLSWSELLVVGIVALIVIGPKDLPGMFAALGRFTAKARAMAREFTRAMEDAAKDSGVKDVAKDLKGLTSPKSLGLDKVQQAVGKFEAWDPLKKATTGTAAKGPATQALSEERAATKARIEQAAAERALARQAATEAAADEAGALLDLPDFGPDPEPDPVAGAPAQADDTPRAKKTPT